MLRPRIIPCLLLTENGLVKTEQFKSPKYVGDPINAVKIFNEKKVDELILIDIEATKNCAEPNYRKLKMIANESRMPLTYGGGIKNVEQAKKIISLGFEKISISSAAYRNNNLISEISKEIGSQSLVITVDYRKSLFSKEYNIYTHNGKKKLEIDIFEFSKSAVKLGAGELVFFSISRDGKMQGYDIDFAKIIRQCVNSQISFIGGAGNTNHMQELIDETGIVGAIAGSFFTFKGKYKAILLTYQKPESLNPLSENYKYL
tara:strand:+ start:170 stop:949 length:780 start_codon:yes stop_codon:yes gene_type:complete